MLQALLDTRIVTFGISYLPAFMSEYPIIENNTLFQCLVRSAVIVAAYTSAWLPFRIGKRKIPYLDGFKKFNGVAMHLLVMKMTDSFEVALVALYLYCRNCR